MGVIVTAFNKLSIGAGNFEEPRDSKARRLLPKLVSRATLESSLETRKGARDEALLQSRKPGCNNTLDAHGDGC